jgi:hypothetical protein
VQLKQQALTLETKKEIRKSSTSTANNQATIDLLSIDQSWASSFSLLLTVKIDLLSLLPSLPLIILGYKNSC